VIWYRHWLELRRLILVAGVVTLLGTVGYGFVVTGVAGYFAKTGHLTTELARYEEMRQLVSGPHLGPGAIHSIFVAFLALFVPFLIAGTGLGAGASAHSGSAKQPSLYFTTSLPLGREWIVGSRLAAGVGGLAGVLAVGLFVHILILLAIGQPIPVIAMVKTSLLGVVVGSALISIASVVSLALSENIGNFATFVMTMGLWVSRDGWSRTLEFVSWSSVRELTTVMAASLLLVAGALMIVRRKEL
jgi:hypothetical protein